MQSIRDGVTFRGTNLWVLIFAILIASIGLNVNSPAVIIGAMLISPLMWPIIGIGVSIAINDSSLLKQAMRNFLFAVSVSLITSTIYFWISPISEAHSELLARTSPNIYDVLIALLGGLAGIIAIFSQKKWNVLPGVAIATALMPPLCTAGYGIATWQWKFIFGALYLFFINSVFIALATFVVSRLLNFPYKEFPDNEERKRSLEIIAFFVILTIIPSIYFGYDVIKQNNFSRSAQNFIENEASFEENYLLKKSIDPKEQKITLIYGGKTITEEQIEEKKNRLRFYELDDANLEIKQWFASLYQKTDEISPNNSYQVKIDELSLALAEKEKEITENTNKKTQEDELKANIWNEIRAISSEISGFFIAENMQFSAENSQNILIIFLETKNEIPSEEKTKLQNWLKTRLKNENIKVIFEKKSEEIPQISENSQHSENSETENISPQNS